MMIPLLSKLIPTTICYYILTCLDPNTTAISNFDLANGNVKLENPFQYQDLILRDPILLGSGGGGAAFSAKSMKIYKEASSGGSSGSNIGKNVVIKVSWSRSTDSVRNECQILQVLKEKNVQGVETCLGEKDYPEDPNRIMIFMEPVIENPVSNILDISKDLQPICVTRLVRTMVQMLAANVVTTDVQPLFFQKTGDLYLIDMTEAQVLKEPLTFMDLARVSSFCSEVSNYIPEAFYGVASNALIDELNFLERNGVYLPQEILDILKGQF